jgi:hypothetical protein
VTGSGHPLNRRLRGYYQVLVPQYHRSPVMTQKSGYDRFPPATNCWGTVHPVPDSTPPLLTEEEGQPT